jgi:hypothetical protein
MVKEIFKPIKNYEGLYEISNLCNVKSLPKQIIRGKYNALRNLPEKILKPHSGSITLVKEGNKKTFDTQTLFKQTFDGYVPDGKRKINLINNDGKILEVKKRQVCQIVKSLHPRKRNTTGVGKSGDKFRADIRISQKDIYLGTYKDEIIASKIYQLACKNELLYQGDAKKFREKLKYLFHLDS